MRCALAGVALAVLGACGPRTGGQETTEMAAFREVPDTVWAKLAAKHIYFGHQSVGGNIMEGVDELVRQYPRLGLRVQAADAPPGDSAGVFLHGAIGRNGDPRLKTEDFARRLEGGLGDRVDIAFHKYCFADILDTTDVESVFSNYRSTMERLHAKYPRAVFVHVTAPLVRVQSGPRALLKKLLGQPPGRYPANFNRERFNALMRQAYAGREPFFDLAALESTRPDGARERIAFGGRSGYALYPGYTGDGSHLNEEGRRRTAEALLVLLADLDSGK
jgi:hypothetical protein